jgi:acetyl esterase/lipase
MQRLARLKAFWRPFLRWSLLLDAVALSTLGMLTVCKTPVWLGWVVGMVVPEIGLWLALSAVAIAAGAWSMRKGSLKVAAVTIGLCTAACCLMLKPAAQAWRLGRTLPDQLTSAFETGSNPAESDARRAPFSFAAALVGRAPQPVPIETMAYSGDLLLDFYRPPTRRGPAPCVIVIHGGSWVSGNRLDDGTKRWLSDDLARRGYAVASIDYRLCPEWVWPAQRDDLLAAIAFVRAHAAALDVDPARIVLLGRSAGAQMATATAYAIHDPGIRGVVAIYPPTDFRLTWDVSLEPGNLDHRLNLVAFLGGTPTNGAGPAYDSASAVKLVTPEAPPTLILQGRLDVNVFHRQAELLDDRLSAAGVPHALVSLPWAAHAFDFVGFNTPGGQVATYAVERFVDAVTR